jgi:hypothetical protein
MAALWCSQDAAWSKRNKTKYALKTAKTAESTYKCQFVKGLSKGNIQVAATARSLPNALNPTGPQQPTHGPGVALPSSSVKIHQAIR